MFNGREETDSTQLNAAVRAVALDARYALLDITVQYSTDASVAGCSRGGRSRILPPSKHVDSDVEVETRRS